MDVSIEKGFINKECEKLALTFDDMNEMIDYIENYSSDDIEWSMLKRNPQK